MGYDKAKKAALWAAYPLHAYYTAPNASKERAYSADPSLGKTEQMVGGVGAPYNKGHQVPNADRQRRQPVPRTDALLQGIAAHQAGHHGTTRNHACGRRTAMHRILVRTNHRQGPDTGQLRDVRGGDRSQMRVRILRQRAERSEKRLLPGGVGPFGQLTPSRKGEAAPAQQRPLFFVSRRQPALSGRIRVEGQRRGRTILQQEGRREVSTGSNRIRQPGGATAAKAPGKDKGARGRGSIDNSRIKRTDEAKKQSPRKKRLKFPGHSSGKPRTPISAPKGKACGRYNSGSGTAASRAP